jgi:hypothetical protein
MKIERIQLWKAFLFARGDLFQAIRQGASGFFRQNRKTQAAKLTDKVDIAILLILFRADTA